ncbi:putative membrane protein At1g16860 [Silene latifolia]|uniref:putative membrane protein At1g16860 n=1 Tax=Silene latifolia TaxID=37657 RepID=UPI003D78385D
MSSRTQSHKLGSGLYVSGKRDNHSSTTTRTPTMSSRSGPYTAADLSKSGELAKMFDISLSSSSLSQPTTPKLPSRTPSQPNSGSGPQPAVPSRLSNSGRVALQPTGLIISGPLTSSAAPTRRSGQLEGNSGQQQPGNNHQQASGKMVYGAAVTNMGKEKGGRYGVKVSKAIMWVFGILVLMGLLVGVFLMVAVKKPVILVAVIAVLVPVMAVLAWNYAWKKRAVLGYVTRFPDTELRGAVDGQFVKVTGVVTCGSIPLESSFQREPRCVYVSTELYEYKGWGGKSANPKHRCFSWGSRHSEKYVADFYVSDFHSGLRALVKSGNGAKVTPLVQPATVADITKEKRDLSPNFLQWLAGRSLSSDDRVMRLKEGYVKEGSTVSVMGVVRRHENIVMIVPPEDPISTGCQWLRCLLPMYIEGLILHCEDNQNAEVIPV